MPRLELNDVLFQKIIDVKKIDKEIFRLSIPNILSNISVPLLSSVDTALMGRLTEQHIGAVGIASMIFNFIYWNFGFLRMGTTGMTAQAVGKNDIAETITVFGRSAFIGIIVAAMLLVLQIPLAESGTYLLGHEGQINTFINEYFYIRIWAAPATIMLYVFMGWFFGMQNATIPLVLTIFINVINILCSYILVHHYQLDIAGVAWGTVIAQYGGVILAGIIFYWKYKARMQYFRMDDILQTSAFKLFLRINGDIFIRTLFLTCAFGFFYAQSSSFGPEILAANVILLQYVNWMSYGIDGFAYAAESLIGKYFGANDINMLDQAVRKSFFWAGLMAILIGLVYAVFSRPLLALFTTQIDVIQTAQPYLIWVILFPIFAFSCYIFDGIFIGLTASKSMRNAMALSFLGFLTVFYFLHNRFENHGLWAALMIFMVFRGLVQWFLFTKNKYRLD